MLLPPTNWKLPLAVWNPVVPKVFPSVLMPGNTGLGALSVTDAEMSKRTPVLVEPEMVRLEPAKNANCLLAAANVPTLDPPAAELNEALSA